MHMKVMMLDFSGTGYAPLARETWVDRHDLATFTLADSRETRRGEICTKLTFRNGAVEYILGRPEQLQPVGVTDFGPDILRARQQRTEELEGEKQHLLEMNQQLADQLRPQVLRVEQLEEALRTILCIYSSGRPFIDVPRVIRAAGIQE